jgi:hypothetical protein
MVSDDELDAIVLRVAPNASTALATADDKARARAAVLEVVEALRALGWTPPQPPVTSTVFMGPGPSQVSGAVSSPKM